MDNKYRIRISQVHTINTPQYSNMVVNHVYQMSLKEIFPEYKKDINRSRRKQN